MDLYLFNTLGRQKQLFVPLEASKVTLYHCGPTVYWVQHIGNMRAVFFADIINRSLGFLGFDTVLVRNYTDVGHLQGDNLGDADDGSDRMQVASLRENLTPQEVAEKYITIYEKDVALLTTLKPAYSPRATEHIPEMIDLIAKLLEKGFAYLTPEAIYFDTTKKTDYTKLSGQKIDWQLAHSGHGDVTATSKKRPSDFALWFFKTGPHQRALQTWPSPFVSPLVEDGQGFPGWHIECSAMSKNYLGQTFDIHMGGIEHIPVHHTNEIAQSESANGVSYANYWLHNEHLLVDNVKMSKSSGTAYTMQDILAHGFTGRDLRMFFLQAHYRSKQNFTWAGLLASQKALRRLDKHLLDVKKTGKVNSTYLAEFTHTICDDFNTSAALAVVFTMQKDVLLSPEDFLATLLECDRVLGLGFSIESTPIIIPKKITKLAEQRLQAKLEKDWNLADKLRDEVESLGYSLSDTKDGFEITKK